MAKFQLKVYKVVGAVGVTGCRRFQFVNDHLAATEVSESVSCPGIAEEMFWSHWQAAFPGCPFLP